MRSRAALPVLLFLALCPYFIDLGGSSIWDANEAFYVETPREMIERGDYINPTFNYEPRLNKPVLSYWIVAAFFNVLGVSPGVQRIPIAIGGLVLIAIAFVLARAAAPAGRSAAGEGGPAVARAAAWWAALGLAVSPRLLMFARRIFIDIYITMFMALTLACFALAERYPARRRVFLVLMYVSVGLGVLTKGPIAVALPGLAFAVYLAAHRELGRMREMLLPLGALIVAAIVVPWYAALYQQAGWDPIKAFLIGENVARFVEGTGVNADHRGLFFYLPVVFSDSFPWSFLLVPAAVMWVRDRSGTAAAATDQRVRALLWIWIVVMVGFFSLSAGKQDLYIFPIVPAVAALAGIAIARVVSAGTGGAGRTGMRPAIGAIGVVLVVAGAAFFALFHGPFAVYVLDGSATIGVIVMTAGAATLVLAASDRIVGALHVTAAALAIASWVFVLRVLPSFEAYKPAPALAASLQRLARPDDLIVTYNVALPSLVYYLRRHIAVYYDHEPVLDLLKLNRPLYLLLTSDDYDRIIAPATPVPLCRIASQPTFDVKLRNVLSRTRLPEVLLVTNRCR